MGKSIRKLEGEQREKRGCCLSSFPARALAGGDCVPPLNITAPVEWPFPSYRSH